MQASRFARPGVILAAGWFLLALYAFPGQMTAESFEALRQARTRFFAPENPPAWSAIWRWCELVLAGPLPMFLVQSVAFLVGAFAILRRLMSERAAAVATAGMLVFPPLMVPLATVWSHSLMTSLLVLGTAALLSESPRAHLGGLAALTLATAAQPHALVATLPIAVMLVRWRADVTGPKRIAQALATWVVITAVALGATKHYSKRPAPPLATYVQPQADSEWFDVPQRDYGKAALKLGVPTRTTALQDAWTGAVTAIADHTPLFSPWLYFGLALLLVPFTIARPVLLVLLVGGVLVFVTYRNPVLLIACTCTAAVATIARWRSRT